MGDNGAFSDGGSTLGMPKEKVGELPGCNVGTILVFLLAGGTMLQLLRKGGGDNTPSGPEPGGSESEGTAIRPGDREVVGETGPDLFTIDTTEFGQTEIVIRDPDGQVTLQLWDVDYHYPEFSVSVEPDHPDGEHVVLRVEEGVTIRIVGRETVQEFQFAYSEDNAIHTRSLEQLLQEVGTERQGTETSMHTGKAAKSSHPAQLQGEPVVLAFQDEGEALEMLTTLQREAPPLNAFDQQRIQQAHKGGDVFTSLALTVLILAVSARHTLSRIVHNAPNRVEPEQEPQQGRE